MFFFRGKKTLFRIRVVLIRIGIRILLFSSVAFKMKDNKYIFSAYQRTVLTIGTFTSVFKDNKLHIVLKSYKTVKIQVFVNILFLAKTRSVRIRNYRSGSRSQRPKNTTQEFVNKGGYRTVPYLSSTGHTEVTRTLGKKGTHQFGGWMFEEGKGGVELCNELGFRFLRQLEDILKNARYTKIAIQDRYSPRVTNILIKQTQIIQ